MESGLIEGVVVTPLKQIKHPKGDLYHAVKAGDNGFGEFGEAYFSTVNFGDIKGWKKHFSMVLNLVVPIGEIRFVVHDDRIKSNTYGQTWQICLGQENYCRLSVPPGVWMAFEGKSQPLNMLLNIASIRHDPTEAVNLKLESINFDWSI